MSFNRRSTLITLWKGNNVFLINLLCPDNSTISKIHAVRETVQDVLEDTCRYLSINRPELFGIALYEHNEYRFISPRKQLNKFLPSAAIVTPKQATELNDVDTRMVLDSTIKSCRLYLRARHFCVSVESLKEQSLYHYAEQVRLDTLKTQNWLNITGYNDVFHSIAAKALWLKHEHETSAVLKENTAPLHYFLPQCEMSSESQELLLNGINKIDLDGAEKVKIDEANHVEFVKKGPNPEKNMENGTEVTKENEVPGILINSQVLNSDYKEYIMLIMLKEATKLPFYGVYYYHVTYLTEESLTSSSCKLGIGPYNVTITLSCDYTTWYEVEKWSWNSVVEIYYNKSRLLVYVSSDETKTTRKHEFECFDDSEAKYLFKQMKESHMQQLKAYRQPRQSDGNIKRNTIGILSEKKQSSLTLMSTPTPFVMRSRSENEVAHGSLKQVLYRTKSD